MADLPPKLFFRIGEVADLVGVEPHVLRYWEREFRSIRPTKSAKGQRVYSRKDVENLLRVRDLLYRDGFTIAGAKKKLSRGVADEHDAADAEGPEAEAVALPEPVPSAPMSALAASSPDAVGVRAKLLALREEVEGFLAELSAPGAPPARPSVASEPRTATPAPSENVTVRALRSGPAVAAHGRDIARDER